MFSVKIVFGSTHDKSSDDQHLEELAGQVKAHGQNANEGCSGKNAQKRKKEK